MNLDFDLTRFFLSIITALGAAAAGILGLFAKFKDDSGKMTTWGKVSIAGIIISLMISLLNSSIDRSQKIREAAVQQKNFKDILTDIRKGLYPMKDIKILAFAELPSSSALVRKYVDRLQAGLGKLPLNVDPDDPFKSLGDGVGEGGVKSHR